jgi:rhodanese-related sulfurtransferase
MKDYIVIDNRETIKDGSIKGAIHLPIYPFILEHGLDALRDKLPQDIKIMLYCDAGKCAEFAKTQLLDNGWYNVVNLGGKDNAIEKIRQYDLLPNELKDSMFEQLKGVTYE